MMIAVLGLIILVITLLAGLPIGFALIFTGSVGIIMHSGIDVLEGILSTALYRTIASFTLSTVPLFILMAHFITRSNIAKDLFNSMLKWLSSIPGGVAIATVISSAGFGAVSGSSVASTSVMARISVPYMVKGNYQASFAAAVVAVSGTLSIMIPPSIPMVIYGIQTETSIGKLFIAGILPGLLITLLLCVSIIYLTYKDRKTRGIKEEKYSFKEKVHSLKTVWPMILLVMIVLASIYTGFATATEAAAIGAFGALIIGLALKRLSFKSILIALEDTVKQSTMILTIVVGAHIFTYFLTLTGIGNDLISAITNSGLSNVAILGLIILLYLILGMFLESIGSLLLTLPLIFPVIISLGYDPVWFGVLVVLLLEIGLITPPVGIMLFIASKEAKVGIEKVFLKLLPLLCVLLICALLFILFPQIALYLPSLIK